MTRFYNGHWIGFEQVTNRYWIGGFGYVHRTEYLVWNPAQPDRLVVLSEADFFALTSEALALAA